MHKNRRKIIVAMSLGLPTINSLAQSNPSSGNPTFPSKLIRIVPFGTAGGPIDAIARAYAEKLQARWGQSVIVDPKPGASGIIAADFVAKAAPDGHTILMTLPLTHVNLPILQPKVPYDPTEDFTPLTMLATGGPMIVCRANAPYNNLKEFIEFAKTKGRLTYGTWGQGSTAHLFGELLRRQTGTDLVHVAYKAEAAAHNDMFGEVLDFAWSNPSTARLQSQAGKMKPLAVAGTRRASILPAVATFGEQGFQGFDVDSWIGMYAPAKLPTDIQNTWVSTLREITAMPDISSRLTSFGFEPLNNTPAQFLERYLADYPRVADLIKAAGVTP
jgi:tripartite-type tricarboxylate transporter receptor subunit TctC